MFIYGVSAYFRADLIGREDPLSLKIQLCLAQKKVVLLITEAQILHVTTSSHKAFTCAISDLWD